MLWFRVRIIYLTIVKVFYYNIGADHQKFGFDPKLDHLGAGGGLLWFRVGIIYLTLVKVLHYNVGADHQDFALE